jgi:hypothetical protein
MHVCIDQSRHDCSASQVDRSPGEGRSGLPAPNGDDSLAINLHPALNGPIDEPVEHESIHKQDGHRVRS